MQITFTNHRLKELEQHLKDRSVTIARKRAEVIIMFDSTKEANAIFDELSEFADKSGEPLVSEG